MRFLLGASFALAAISISSWFAFAGTSVSESSLQGVNEPPVCCFGPDCQQTGLIETVECAGDETVFMLDATGSFDPEGQALTFSWESCPGSTIDDPTSPITILRLDTSLDCAKYCGVRLIVSDGVSDSYCRLFVQVEEPVGGCTYTQGYWKTHGPVGCAAGGNLNEWPVDNLDLGNVNYTAAQLCSIFRKTPGGNGLVALAHQLIAAELNVANGAALPTEASDAIDAANDLIGDLVVPPVGTGFLSPDITAPLVAVLTAYNQGEIAGAVHCD
jgi:hypothetical protein